MNSSPATPRCELEAAELAVVDAALAQYRGHPGPLLQVLHAIQNGLGHVPASALPVVAESLNLSRAEVYGVVTFYHYFRLGPSGRRVLRLCQAEACRSMHCEDLTAYAKRRLGIDFHQTTADGQITLEPVYCLGNCACAPAVMLDGELHGRVTPERLDELLAPPGAPR